ncbi:hypothetical protein BGZ74_002875, partial [Mortierella antarctica]
FITPSDYVPPAKPAKARKLPIRYTDDHHDVIITWFFANWDLYYNHRRGNGVSTNNALAQLRQHLLEQIATLGLAPIPEELLTDQALLEKWGRMQRDIVRSPIARQLSRRVSTGEGENFLSPEGEFQGIPGAVLTRREDQNARLWFFYRGTPTTNPAVVFDIGAVPDEVGAENNNGRAPEAVSNGPDRGAVVDDHEAPPVPASNGPTRGAVVVDHEAASVPVVTVYDSNDEDEPLAELHHLFAMPESPFPFLPDDEEQSFSSVQRHHPHAPSTQTTVYGVGLEDEEEVEQVEDGEYVAVHNVMDKGKRVASSPSTHPSFTQAASMLSSSSSSRISRGQSGIHSHTPILSPSSPQLSQLSSCATARPASSSQVNRKRRRVSHFPATPATSQTVQAESSRTAQLRDNPDAQARDRQDRIVEDRLLDALGRPAPSGRTHPVYATNNPPRAVPPLLSPSQASASTQSLSSSLVHYTESKLSMHSDRMKMQAKKMDILQGAVKCFEIMLTRERPARRPRHYYHDEWDHDVDEQEPETEDEREYEKD